MSEKIIQMADSIHGNIQISELEKAVIATEAFNRLHNIHQNSTAYLTYPSNQTNRFAHSLGVMHLGGQIFFHGLANATTDTLLEFFKTFASTLDAIICDDGFGALLRTNLGQHVQIVSKYTKLSCIDCLYKTNIPQNIKSEHVFMYSVLYQALRCTALLHDIGHPPFSHVAETALKEITTKVISGGKQNGRKIEFKKCIEYYSGNKELHEKIGIQIADRLLDLVTRSIKKELLTEEEATKVYFYMLVQKVTRMILKDETHLMKSLHKIVDGPLDCDRLDYVTRDLQNSGFVQGRMAYDRLIHSMKLLKHSDEGIGFIICPDIRSLSTLEDFFHLRWLLYKYVIYHHRVIKTDELLKKAIIKLALDYIDENMDIAVSADDNYALPLDISGLWKALKVQLTDSDYFNPLFQWDDAWLNTVLRQLYFSKYRGQTTVVEDQLEELLSNRKKYFSIIKRSHDFLEIDKAIVEYFSMRWTDLAKAFEGNKDPLVEKLRRHVNAYKNSENIWRKEAVSSGLFSRNLKAFIELLQGAASLEEGGSLKLFAFEKIVEKSITEISSRYGFKDCIVVFKGLKNNKPIYINRYNPSNGIDEVIELIEVSTIELAIKQEQELFPIFFVYVSGIKDFNLRQFQKDLGLSIAEKLAVLFLG